MECTLSNSTYEYTLSFVQGEMSVDRAHVAPNTPMLPHGAILMAPYMDIYQEFAAFHGSGLLYRDLLAGNVSMAGQDSWVVTSSDISDIELIDPGSGFPYSLDLPGTIEAGLQSIYRSLLSDVVQYSQIDVDAPCQVSSHVLVWRYQPLWLAVPYAVAIVLTFASAAVGLHAIIVNGYCAQTNFSTFMVTTRNDNLHELARGSCLGAWPMKKEVRETRLRFGETVAGSAGEGGVAHAAFGFPGQVTTLVRGKKYE